MVEVFTNYTNQAGGGVFCFGAAVSGLTSAGSSLVNHLFLQGLLLWFLFRGYQGHMRQDRWGRGCGSGAFPARGRASTEVPDCHVVLQALRMFVFYTDAPTQLARHQRIELLDVVDLVGCSLAAVVRIIDAFHFGGIYRRGGPGRLRGFPSCGCGQAWWWLKDVRPRQRTLLPSDSDTTQTEWGSEDCSEEVVYCEEDSEGSGLTIARGLTGDLVVAP